MADDLGSLHQGRLVQLHQLFLREVVLHVVVVDVTHEPDHGHGATEYQQNLKYLINNHQITVADAIFLPDSKHNLS